jgi:hypothetical protein
VTSLIQFTEFNASGKSLWIFSKTRRLGTFAKNNEGCKPFGFPKWLTCKSCIATHTETRAQESLDSILSKKPDCGQFWDRDSFLCYRAKLAQYLGTDKKVANQCHQDQGCQAYAWKASEKSPDWLKKIFANETPDKFLENLISKKENFQQCASALQKHNVVSDAGFQQKTWDSCFGDTACLKKAIESKLEPGIIKWNLKNKTVARQSPECLKFLASSAPVDSTHSIWLYDVRSTRNASITNFL